jgi:heat shock protein HslJ
MPDLDLLDRLAPDVDTDAGLLELGRRRRRARWQRRALPAFIGAVALLVLVGGVVIATRATTTGSTPELDPADLVITPNVTETVTPGDPRLAGTDWLLTSWTSGDGVAQTIPEPVPTGPVRLGFLDRIMFGTTGCNSLRGTWSLDGDTLLVDGPNATGLSCGQELTTLEKHLLVLLQADPSVQFGPDRGGTITLSAPDKGTAVFELTTRTMELVEERYDTDVALVASGWRLVGWSTGESSGRPVADVRTVLTFSADGSLGVITRCGSSTGTFVLEGATLRATPGPTRTCGSTIPQEQLLTEVLGEASGLHQQGDTLTLATPTAVLQFAAERFDHPITDQTWQVTAWETDGVSHRVAAVGDAELRFLPNGSVGGSAGCNGFGGRFTVEDGRVEMLDGTGSTTKACYGDVAALEGAMTALLQPGTDVDIAGDQLVLRNGDTTVTFRGEG